MDATLKLKFSELKHAGVSRVLIDYFNARLEEHKNSLLIASDDNLLRQLQGRAHEISDLIKLLKE